MSLSLSERSQARPRVKGETVHKAVRSPQHIQGCVTFKGVAAVSRVFGMAFNRFAGRLILFLLKHVY